MSKKSKTKPTLMLRVCRLCGEVFETYDDVDTCPSGCRHRWGNGNYDPADWDDIDANKKSEQERET